MTRSEIGAIVGVHADTVGRWLKLDKRNLQVNRGGRKYSEARRLTTEAENAIRKKLIDKTPDQLKLKNALWTRQTIQELIHHETGLLLPARTVSDYLKRWGMTPQKPQKRAYERRAQEVQKWLRKEYAEIKTRAKKEAAEIYWVEQAGLRIECRRDGDYLLKEVTPVTKLNVNRVSLSMISAITNQGKTRFQLIKGYINSKALIEFFERLLIDAKRKIYVILDNHRIHYSKPVETWIAKHKAMIEVYYLPLCSPDPVQMCIAIAN